MSSQSTDRRRFLTSGTLGVGSVALAWLLKQDGLLAEPSRPELEPQHFDLRPKKPPLPAQAKAMISLFMQGGPSHLDLFDPKPTLVRLNGTNYAAGDIKPDSVKEASSELLASPWKFERRGQCGMEISELLPHVGEVVDDITLIRSMYTGVNNHEPSIYSLNTGRSVPGRPALGSWLTYGLGSESQDLPAFVVLTDPAGSPVLGPSNWSNAWLPAMYQGTVVRPREPRIANLDPPARLKGRPQKRYLAYLAELNRQHYESHSRESELEARIASYELAARMQTAAKSASTSARRPRPPANCTAWTTRSRKIMARVPDCPAAHRTGSPLRSDLHQKPVLGSSWPDSQGPA